MLRLPLVTALAAVCLVGASPASAGGPLRTGFFDPLAFNNVANQAHHFNQARATGASVVRLSLHWPSIAPQVRLPLFDPANPSSPGYFWTWFDTQLRLAKARGLEPIAEIAFAPRWASGDAEGLWRPDPVEYGKFARAAAIRYSGSYSPLPGQPPLPRIRFWLAWGESNRDYHLMPQYEGGRIASAILYRSLVNQLANGVQSVDPSNQVVAGALAPLGRPGKPAPLAFMREMLCLSRTLGRTCDLRGDPVRADIWAHHAYTMGGPTHRVKSRDDVSIGELPKLRRYLRAATRLGHLRPRGPLGFWVTEFGWDSSPPDPQGLPPKLHARWTSEALYRMWKAGVSVVTWWRIQDDPLHVSRYQTGFFGADGRPKYSLTAFRFPVVAFRRSRGVFVWGRTPSSAGGRVVVQIKTGGGWRRAGSLRANGHGIFQGTLGTRARRGSIRAFYGGQASLPFSLTRVRDRTIEPFGCGNPAPC